MPESARGKFAWWLLLLLICTHFCLVYVQNDHSFLDLDQYMQGRAKLPYQYRLLMVWVLRLGLRLPYLRSIAAHCPGPLSDPRILLLFGTSWVSLAGSVLLTWRSLTLLTKDEEYSRWASLLVVYMAYFEFPWFSEPLICFPTICPAFFSSAGASTA